MIEWNRVTWYSKLVAVFVFLIVFALGILAGIAYEQTKATSSLVEQNYQSDAHILGMEQLPVHIQNLAVNIAEVDVDNDGVKDIIKHPITAMDCGTGGCPLYINGRVVTTNTYPPIYGIFRDKKLSQLIVTQSIDTPGCSAEACRQSGLVLYQYNPSGQATLIDEGVTLPADAVLIFSSTANERMNTEWETYSDAGRGYEINYPSAWGSPRFVSLGTRARGVFPNGSIRQWDNGFTFEVGTFDDQQSGRKMTVGEIIDSYKNNPDYETTIYPDFMIGSKVATKIDVVYKKLSPAKFTYVYVQMDDTGNIFEAVSITQYIGEDIFNKVIELLKFTK